MEPWIMAAMAWSQLSLGWFKRKSRGHQLFLSSKIEGVLADLPRNYITIFLRIEVINPQIAAEAFFFSEKPPPFWWPMVPESCSARSGIPIAIPFWDHGVGVEFDTPSLKLHAWLQGSVTSMWRSTKALGSVRGLNLDQLWGFSPKYGGFHQHNLVIEWEWMGWITTTHIGCVWKWGLYHVISPIAMAIVEENDQPLDLEVPYFSDPGDQKHHELSQNPIESDSTIHPE